MNTIKQTTSLWGRERIRPRWWPFRSFPVIRRHRRPRHMIGSPRLNIFSSHHGCMLLGFRDIDDLDRCRTCNFIARFCRATLSRDKIASVTCRVAQYLNSRATPFPIRTVLYSVQLCRENAVNADWSILVCATVAVCDMACHVYDFVAR